VSSAAVKTLFIIDETWPFEWTDEMSKYEDVRNYVEKGADLVSL
jgi:hypothetical protein